MHMQKPDPGRRKALRLLGLSSVAVVVGLPATTDTPAIAMNTGKEEISGNGGTRTFPRPHGISEDWVLYLRAGA